MKSKIIITAAFFLIAILVSFGLPSGSTKQSSVNDITIIGPEQYGYCCYFENTSGFKGYVLDGLIGIQNSSDSILTIINWDWKGSGKILTVNSISFCNSKEITIYPKHIHFLRYKCALRKAFPPEIENPADIINNNSQGELSVTLSIDAIVSIQLSKGRAKSYAFTVSLVFDKTGLQNYCLEK